ncbi:MAG: hypothetical protein N2234_03680, partial [Planctomycetota bacterium]|nr:hypothetical protein [Planctomycetota bacterium]
GGFFTNPATNALSQGQQQFKLDLARLEWYEYNSETNRFDENKRRTSDLLRILRLPGTHRMRCYVLTYVEFGGESWVSVTFKVTYLKEKKPVKPPRKEPRDDKKEEDKVPPLQDNWHLVFENGKSLKWWKASAEGIWTVEGNELIGRNNTNQEQWLITNFEGCEKWFDMEVKLKVMVTKGECRFGLRRSIASQVGGWLRGRAEASWKEWHWCLSGNKLEVVTPAGRQTVTDDFDPKTPGGVMILLTPGAEVKIEYVKVKVLSTK